jgi:hypothetical protein
MNGGFPILFAAPWNEIVSVLVGLVFLIIWVINQIADAKKKQDQHQQPRAEEVPLEPVGAPAPQAGGQADPLRAQVEEFLRRAGQQAKPPAPTPPRPSAPQEKIVVLLDESQAAPPRRSLADKMRDSRRPKNVPPAPIPGKQRRPQPAPQQPRAAKPRQTVAEHVAERIGTASEAFEQEVADLGSRVKQADAQFDVQLQQKFDQDLGGWSDRKVSTSAEPSLEANSLSPGAQVAAMLASPAGVRQAVILNEILRRPTDRW